MEEFYYKKSVLNRFIGVLSMLSSVLHLIMFVVLFNGSRSLLIVLPLITSLLSLMLGIFYLRLERRMYVSVMKDEISIDRGMVIPPFRFNINDVTLARLVENIGL